MRKSGGANRVTHVVLMGESAGKFPPGKGVGPSGWQKASGSLRGGGPHSTVLDHGLRSSSISGRPAPCSVKHIGRSSGIIWR